MFQKWLSVSNLCVLINSVTAWCLCGAGVIMSNIFSSVWLDWSASHGRINIAFMPFKVKSDQVSNTRAWWASTNLKAQIPSLLIRIVLPLVRRFSCSKFDSVVLIWRFSVQFVFLSLAFLCYSTWLSWVSEFTDISQTSHWKFLLGTPTLPLLPRRLLLKAARAATTLPLRRGRTLWPSSISLCFVPFK